MSYTQFVDEYLDDLIIGFPCYSSPRFSTAITTSDGGGSDRNRHWQHPLRTFRLPKAVREHEQLEALKDHWLVMGGPEMLWPFTDPLDFASVRLQLPNVSPEITLADQIIGVGDGITRSFQITKTYRVGGRTYARPIYLPHDDTLLPGIAGYAPEAVPGDPFTWTVTREGGVITFDHAPAEGASITAGYYFDVAVRFQRDDSFDGIVESYQVSGFADLTLEEERPC